VVFIDGLTVILCPVPVFDHKYPLYVTRVDRIVELPLQTGFMVGVIAGVGNGFAVNVVLVEVWHPFPSVTVTVYVPVTSPVIFCVVTPLLQL
jgi:phage shock protein PspC (stress-responsive transcriptional regulator)